MITAMTYGELTRGLHLDNPVPNIGLLTIGSGTTNDSVYHYCLDSPMLVPAPSMHDLDYFPHRVLLLAGKCSGCLRAPTDRVARWDATDARCGCAYAPGGCAVTGGCNFSRSSTPRNSSSVSVRRANTHPRSKPPYSRHRNAATSSASAKKIQRSRSLTDIHSSGALAPSPLRNCAAYDESGLPVRVGQVYESHPESVHMPGMKRVHTYYPVAAPQYVPTPTTARQGSLHTPPTVTTRNAYSMSTPSSSYGGTPIGGNTPATAIMTTPATSIMVTPASAISPVSPIRTRFGFPMTHAPLGAFGEGAAARPEPEERRPTQEESWKVQEEGWKQAGGGWGGQEGPGMEMEEDARTEVGSPEMSAQEDVYGTRAEEESYSARPISDVRLPPVRSFMPPAAYPLAGPTAQQTRRAMRSSAVPQDVLLYGPAGVTPAPAELARNNACDKLPPIPSMVPPRQATFYGIQNLPVVDGSGRFATMCAPGQQRPIPARPVYPPAGIAPLIAGHIGLPHGGLTAPIERGDEMIQWKEAQRAKERADIVVKDGELTVAERLEMEKRVSMSVKVINHIYYGADDLPKTRSPTQPTRRLPEDGSSRADAGPSSSARGSSVREAYWPPTPSSMPSSPESPKTRRDRQRASMRKDVFGERAIPAPKNELEEMVRAIGSPGLASEEQGQEESDPSREPPARTLTWFVTEVLRRSRTSINVLQVALAYLAGAKPEIHTQLRAAADRQAELAMQIAGLPQHVRDALPGMDWLGSEFTPSPLIDPRRTFLASLVLASKFLLDKAFSNKAWAKLSGLEALEVGKCERALGTALNWRLWVGREASRETHLDHAPAPPPAMLSPAVYHAPIRSFAQENPVLSRVQDVVSPARSNSPWGSHVTSGSTPTLDSSSDLGSDPGVLPGFDEVSQFTHTPEAFGFPGEVVVGAEEMLHRSPETGYLRAAPAGSMHFVSDAGANSRPTLPSIRSFDRPALRHGPSEIATPQTDSNMGCGHMPSICLDRPSANELPLAYANLGRPWEAVQQPHWDFTRDGVVGE